MKLTKNESRLLEHLMGTKATMSEAASALHMQKPNLAKYAKKLEACGLLSAKKEGRAKTLSDAGTAMRFSELRKTFPQLRLHDILAGYAPSLISWASGRQEFTLKDVDLPAATAKRLLANLRHQGVFHMPKKGTYKLREEAKSIARFCIDTISRCEWELAEKELHSMVSMASSFGSAKGAAALIMAEKEEKPEHFWPTYSLIAHFYGLQLLGAGTFYYTNIKPDLGDLIIHTLDIEHNARGVLYASFLALKNNYDVRLLLKKRHIFGLTKEYLQGFVDFVQSRGKKPFAGLDSLEELKAMGYGHV